MSAPRVLALRALGMGDLLTGVPALRGLAAGLGEHRLLLAAPAWLGPLIVAIDAVDEHVPVGELEPLPPALHGVEVAVNLHGSGPRSHQLLLEARPRRLLAFRHPAVPASADGPAWCEDEHEVHRWCRLLRAYDLPGDPDALDLSPPRDVAVPAVAAEATVIHPGAKSGARRWPVEGFAAVARARAEAGHRVVVTGSDGERPIAAAVARGAGLPDAAVLAGRLSLAQLMGVVASADRVVCGDTGVAHLATALGTPSVILFGPTPPHTWGPPPARRGRHRVVWRGATGDPLADRPFEGLLAITVEEVLAELAALDAAA